jgi:hypothetical protein
MRCLSSTVSLSTCHWCGEIEVEGVYLLNKYGKMGGVRAGVSEGYDAALTPPARIIKIQRSCR